MWGFIRREIGEIRAEKRDTGQAVVIFIFLLTGLVAMMGLAIDGGRLFLAQRDAQNAVDAAILASARSLCVDDVAIQAGSDIWQTKGFNVAAANGFVNGSEQTEVNIIHPTDLPANAPGSSTEYVAVTIRRQIEPFFIQIVYNGPLTITVEGIARCKPAQDASFFKDNALVACSTDCNAGNPGIKVNGNGTITIGNGGTFSNCPTEGYKDAGGGASEGGLVLDTPGFGNEAVAPSPCYAGDDISPPPTCDATPIVCPDIPGPPQPPTCTGDWILYDKNGSVDQTGTSPSLPKPGNGEELVLNPGCYDSLDVTNGDVVMMAGNYYFTGCMKFTGGTMTATNVFVFLNGTCTNVLNISGKANLLWSAPSSGDYSGLLLLHNNCGGIQMGGQGTYTIVGTIYAPCSSVDLGGSSAGGVDSYTFTGQIIGGTISTGGNGDLTLNYGEPFSFPSIPPSVTIVQ